MANSLESLEALLRAPPYVRPGIPKLCIDSLLNPVAPKGASLGEGHQMTPLPHLENLLNLSTGLEMLPSLTHEDLTGSKMEPPHPHIRVQFQKNLLNHVII